MKIAEVHKADLKADYPSLEEISAWLDGQPKMMIDTLNWKTYDYKPVTKFAIAYSNYEILLKYYVTEQYLKAEKTISNEMVCEDSCVEFFVSPADDGIYYNMEFNAIGTCLLGEGKNRETSFRVDHGIISKIRRLTSEGSVPFKEKTGEFSWTITIAIPFDVFLRHHVKGLKGKIFRANFYKCGDMLTVPHYVTWNPVGTLNPDYHQPEYFGQLKFV